jgi:hypothetical protein
VNNLPSTFVPAGATRQTGRRVFGSLATSKRIAALEVSALHPALEPVHPLSRGAVGEGVGIHVAGRHPLDSIVAHGGRRAQPLLDVSRLENVLQGGLVSPAAFGEPDGLSASS